TFDLNGNQLSQTVDNTGGTPAALTSTAARDPRGLVTLATDAGGTTTAYTHDAAGQRVTATGIARTVWRDGVQTTGVAPVTTFGHNTFGDVPQERDAYGSVTTTVYDKASRATSVTKPSYTPPGGT